jgi:hypothetical protein
MLPQDQLEYEEQVRQLNQLVNDSRAAAYDNPFRHKALSDDYDKIFPSLFGKRHVKLWLCKLDFVGDGSELNAAFADKYLIMCWGKGLRYALLYPKTPSIAAALGRVAARSMIEFSGDFDEDVARTMQISANVTNAHVAIVHVKPDD